HFDYVKYIVDHGQLPPFNMGVETYHPPLFYWLAAAMVRAGADMQSLGEGLGDALRTFKQAVADVRNSVDPEMRTIQAEMDAAQKEIQQSIEAAKELPAAQEEPQKPT
ncbi:MAG TPA: hypothetical protein VFP40_11440, partial [Terriglobales bacterium]|nr:hypothetical protein [Terriglobales bacterium]